MLIIFSSDEDINEISFLSYLCHEYFFVIKEVDEQHMIPFSLYFLKLLEIIKLSKNYGQDSAIMSGLKYAKNDFVAIMDDDLQHHPKYLKYMTRSEL